MTTRHRVLGALVAAVASIAAAIVYLALNDWFGAGDLVAMAMWSVPLVGLTYAVLSIPWFAPSKHAALRYPLAAIAGLLVAIILTALGVLAFGGWMGGFSFPVLFCWAFGSIVGMIAGLWAEQPGAWGAPATMFILAALGLAQGFAYVMSPPPRVVLYLKQEATPKEVSKVWREVLGVPHPSGRGHSLKSGISGVARSGVEGENATLTVSFRKTVSDERRQALLDTVLASPVVERIRIVTPSEERGVRQSVEY